MKRLATVLGGAALLLAPLSAHGQTLSNRYNPTGSAGPVITAQYRGAAVHPTTGRLYITSSAAPIGVSYWDFAAWNNGTAFGAPTGSFAPTKPDASSWGTASPYGITVSDDGLVFVYAFSDKKIYVYNGDGVFQFKVSTDGGTTDYASTATARFLHSTGSYTAGTLRLYLVQTGDPGSVYRVTMDAANTNDFTENVLFTEANNGATNYAAQGTVTGDTVYVASNGTLALRRYVNTGGTWGVDTGWAPVTGGQAVHDIQLANGGKGVVVTLPGIRALRVYDALDATRQVGVNFGASGAAFASGGVGLYGDDTVVAVSHVNATTSYRDVIDASPVLPVELVSLTAAASGSDAVVRWTTASETNNASFAIEALRGSAWTELATVAGRGTTSERADYETRLSGLGTGRHTLRLVQRDVDGTATVAGTVELVIGQTEALALLVRSNGTDAPVVGLVARESGSAVVTVSDVMGRTVARYAVAADAGARTDLSVDGLAAGVYVVRASGRTGTATTTLVVR